MPESRRMTKGFEHDVGENKRRPDHDVGKDKRSGHNAKKKKIEHEAEGN